MRLLALCAVALVFGFVGSMPLAGPIALLVLSRATRKRFGEAIRIGLGAAAAEGIYAGFAFWGFTTFLASHAIVVPISHAMTALILIALGVRFGFWTAGEHHGPKDAPSGAGTVFFGFSVSAINPTLLLTWSTAVAFLYSKGLHEPSASYAIPFGLSAAVGIGAWFSVFVLLMRKYGGKLPLAALTWTVRVLGWALVVLGAWSGVQLVEWLAAR
ncbi:MAG: LysE family transporter [Polyangiaceae bacterium]